MNKNKGIIGIGLILVIVLGIVVVGGGAYYLGKKSAKIVEGPSFTNKVEENNSHEVPTGPYGDETNYVAPPTLCNSESKPSIKVITPNGGEVFNLGQTINIKWNSNCIDSKAFVYLNIGIEGSQAVPELLYNMKVSNTGSYNFTIPSDYNVGGNKSNKYVVELSYSYGNGEQASDISDNSFTINYTTVSTTSCTSDKGNSMTFQKALEIAKASSCNSVGKFTKEYNCNKNAGGLVDVYMEPTNKPSCGFACRVSIDTGKVEEGWMCTGAMLPSEKIYTNSDYGFSFNYPNDWKLSENKSNKEVTISTNDLVNVSDGGHAGYPSWSITFKATDKTFFNSVTPTKMGVITYNEKESAVFADDRCIKAEKLLGGNVQVARYGGSTMSDPAYSNSAILTTNGKIIIVNSYQGVAITPELENQLSAIFNSFKLLNGNQVFVPECAK